MRVFGPRTARLRLFETLPPSGSAADVLQGAAVCGSVLQCAPRVVQAGVSKMCVAAVCDTVCCVCVCASVLLHACAAACLLLCSVVC